jgi:hypothetical protein
VKSLRLLPLIVAGLLFLPSISNAAPITFNYSNGDLSAWASFDVSGGNLVATLTNTSTVDPSAPNQILTAVFFDIAGDSTLSQLTAVICATCTITQGGGTTNGTGNVAGEWAYNYSSTDLAYGDSYGISSSGLDLFGPHDLFPGGTNLSGSTSPAGVQYGITTTNDGAANNNGGLSGNPLISNQVIFTLAGLSSGFNLASISNVTFQYGTALNEVPVGVPEPASAALLGTGVVMMLVVVRRRKLHA